MCTKEAGRETDGKPLAPCAIKALRENYYIVETTLYRSYGIKSLPSLMGRSIS
jgi:hypothetical protein